SKSPDFKTPTRLQFVVGALNSRRNNNQPMRLRQCASVRKCPIRLSLEPWSLDGRLNVTSRDAAKNQRPSQPLSSVRTESKSPAPRRQQSCRNSSAYSVEV